MSDSKRDTNWFCKDGLKLSDYPSNFIPKGARTVVGVDEGSPDGDCTVKGCWLDGVFHVQEIVRLFK